MSVGYRAAYGSYRVPMSQVFAYFALHTIDRHV